MDNALQIMSAIGDMKNDIQKDLGEIKVSIAEVATAHKATIARVETIESDAKFRKKVNTVFMVGVIPVVGALHQLAVFFHWIK